MSNGGFRAAAQRAREQREDDDRHPHSGDDPLQCFANGCPARASMFVEGSRGFCSWHSGQPAREWPRITDEVRLHIAQEREKRLAADIPMDHEQAPRMTPVRLAEIKETIRKKMSELGTRSHGIEWALRLREIDENPELTLPHGKRLTPAQREMYRTALRNRGVIASPGAEIEP